ncbi:putative zinc finger MYM-type protein 1-like [Apostichopus japonicus]|uniref:Putative zinc finger MYM-type protein 1-like n=1 Tax=Stichopus japonicus TaxID=307972 RepID=A0A2G8JZF8_STIJA|nr:putative zinc finger MYM-type protein 1-like [Apostichopus japonicus]
MDVSLQPQTMVESVLQPPPVDTSPQPPSAIASLKPLSAQRSGSSNAALPSGEEKSDPPYPAIKEHPYQPDQTDFMTTQMVSTKTKRGFTVLKFQRQWFDKFGWLHCDVKSGKVFCHACITAITRGLVHLERDHETNFLIEGFCNWKKSMEKFKQHQASDLHELCILKLQAASQKPVTAQLSDHASKEQVNAQHALVKLITSMRYLATEGAALRGKENDGGKFRKLLDLRSEDDEDLRQFMKRTTNFTSHEIQNEILAIMSRQVLQNILRSVNEESKIFATIVDGTTDISGNEQECVCVRFIDKELGSERTSSDCTA